MRGNSPRQSCHLANGFTTSNLPQMIPFASTLSINCTITETGSAPTPKNWQNKLRKGAGYCPCQMVYHGWATRTERFAGVLLRRRQSRGTWKDGGSSIRPT